jgi:hypothetical protein
MKNYMQKSIYTIYHYIEQKDGEPVHDINTSGIPTDILPQIVHAMVYDMLARSGIKYQPSELEKRFGIRIDYFKALNDAVDRGKQLIDDDFRIERQKAFNTAIHAAKERGIDVPSQMFIDFK